jgi:hypothetical protein
MMNFGGILVWGILWGGIVGCVRARVVFDDKETRMPDWRNIAMV